MTDGASVSRPLAGSLRPEARRGRLLLVGCLAVAFVSLAGAVMAGSVAVPPAVLLRLLAGAAGLGQTADIPAKYATILFDIRLPRVALMALTGAALSVAGATYQGLFRNPLADPYLVGSASGAGLGAVIVITVLAPVTPLGLLAVPLGAFLGGLLAVAAAVAIGRVGRTTPVTTMLLAGVAISAFASAITTFWMLRSPDGLRRAFNWLLGGYAGGGWQAVWLVLPFVAVGLLAALWHAHGLNVLQLGEEQAQQLGLPVERLKLVLIAAATLMTAAAVAFGGLIGFVGLVVPHILRLLGGPDHRRLIPLSALGGMAFLAAADLVARTALAPQEIPVGVVTALAGAPFFVFLLRQVKRAVF